MNNYLLLKCYDKTTTEQEGCLLIDLGDEEASVVAARCEEVHDFVRGKEWVSGVEVEVPPTLEVVFYPEMMSPPLLRRSDWGVVDRLPEQPAGQGDKRRLTRNAAIVISESGARFEGAVFGSGGEKAYDLYSTTFPLKTILRRQEVPAHG
jgi:hypothetical protein